MSDYFNFIKYLYSTAREYEWKKLRKHLKDNNMNIVNGRSGCGSQTYSSNRKLNPPYDLSNWRWIEVKAETGVIFISFQPFEIDTRSNNKHVLFDRIGISWYAGAYNAKYVYDKMLITDIELPLDENKMEKICYIIKYLSNNITTEITTWKQVSKEIGK